MSGGGKFTMAGGTIFGNTAFYGGGVYVFWDGTFEMAGGGISGNAAGDDGGGVCVGGDIYAMVSGTFTVLDSPVVSGNTNSVGMANNVWLYDITKIVVSNLTAGASFGVTTAVDPTEDDTVTITTGAAAGDAKYFFSDNPACHVEYVDGTLRLASGMVYPGYLDGATENVTNNWVTWAGQYGANTNAEYEGHFLLGISPATTIPEGAAMLKVVDFQVTENGYRFELASDVCDLYHPDGDAALLCNGYAAVKIAADLGEFSRNAESSQNAKGGAKIMYDPVVEVEKITLPVPVTIDAATGHAVIDLDISSYQNRNQKIVRPPSDSFTLPPPPLFFRVLLTPIKPDYMQELQNYR